MGVKWDETLLARESIMALTTDLFLNKKQQVLEFIKRKGRARTSEVAAFGVSIYHPDRACRDARDLAAEIPPRIWRMRQDLKEIVYGKTKEDIWSVYISDADEQTLRKIRQTASIH